MVKNTSNSCCKRPHLKFCIFPFVLVNNHMGQKLSDSILWVKIRKTDFNENLYLRVNKVDDYINE